MNNALYVDRVQIVVINLLIALTYRAYLQSVPRMRGKMADLWVPVASLLVQLGGQG
jgi:hypothetical protein